MNYAALVQAIQAYSENTEQLFVSNIPLFVQEAELRIYNSVQIPVLRKNVTGNVTTSNPYLSCPDDFMAVYSLAAINASGSYNYLIDKDVSFIREAYPNPSATGLPKYYAIFGPQLTYPTELSLMLVPTPDDNYTVELHYYYMPESIVQGAISVLNTLVGGAGYTSGTYTNVPLSGGSGTGATATILVVGGIVTQVTLSNAGSSYIAGNLLTTSNIYLGGTGASFSITVAAINNSTGTSWLGDNYDPVLFYGAMREAMIFMKGEADMVGYYEQKYQEALAQLKRLGDGMERGDSYRNNQTKLPYSSL
jgi:hypothetical protein